MSINRRRLLLALLIVSGILNYADRQIIAVLKPLLQDRLQWSDGDYGHLTAIFQFAAALAYLGSGWVVDRVGWRRANTLAVGTWSMAAMAHAAARTLGQFAVARIALGATESLGTPTAIKTIAVLFEARGRSAALGAMNAAGNVGAIITPLFAPALALTFGWEAAFLITGGAGLVWVAAWLLVMAGEKAPRGANRDAGLEVSAGGAAAPDAKITGDANVGTDAITSHGEPVSWRMVLTDRRTWAIAGGKVLSDQVWWFLLFWAPDFFHRVFHLDMRGFAVPLALIYGTAAFGSLLGGFASGRLIAGGMGVTDARKATMLVCALLVTPVPLALLVDNYWIAVGLLSLTLAAHQGFSVNLFALATDVTPSSRVGTVISVAALFGNLSGMVVLQAAGWLIGGGYGYGPLLGLAAVSYLLALGWVRLLLPKGSAAEQALVA
ncbi:MAG: transporter [Gammaproteobacteria bacterium]|jgi:ACS family hexuronate transporter-like MFS transporter|nr:transporter [Gammaproteobacteria bacterium]